MFDVINLLITFVCDGSGSSAGGSNVITMIRVSTEHHSCGQRVVPRHPQSRPQAPSAAVENVS